MSRELKDMREYGGDIPADDQGDIDLEELLELIDFDKFNRGRDFFKRNLCQCMLAMLFSLVSGLSVNNLLDVLVETGKSSTPKDSLIRYLHTFKHVLKWHYGNVLDRSSDAAKSLQHVRQMHNSARQLMARTVAENGKVNKKKLHVSQYDMSLVQCGFIGAIIMYPQELGIKCTKEELEDYVYLWRWIGYLLGIDDDRNLCTEGYVKAYKLCKAIERDILFPALDDPPEQFYPMAHAVTDGINMPTFIKLYSPVSILASIPGYTWRKKISFKDRFRVYFNKLLFLTFYHIPWLGRFFNQRIEQVMGCHRMT